MIIKNDQSIQKKKKKKSHFTVAELDLELVSELVSELVLGLGLESVSASAFYNFRTIHC
jgi:hypothetical protein